MTLTSTQELTSQIDRVCIPMHGGAHDHDDLLDAVGDRSIVMLGEATHGTHEFYSERARITARLIEERGFTAVAVEGDWRDAYRVHRYVTPGPPMTAPPKNAVPISGDSRHGCGATSMSFSSSTATHAEGIPRREARAQLVRLRYRRDW